MVDRVNSQLSIVNEESPRNTQHATRDTLVCISPPAHSFLNSTFGNVDRFLKREGEPLLRIHPQDAAPRQIEDGDTVRVANALGEVLLIAEVTADIIPGTVLAPGVWWAKHSPDGRNINQVTAQDEADMGAGAIFYDAVVTVEKSLRINLLISA